MDQVVDPALIQQLELLYPRLDKNLIRDVVCSAGVEEGGKVLNEMNRSAASPQLRIDAQPKPKKKSAPKASAPADVGQSPAYAEDQSLIAAACDSCSSLIRFPSTLMDGHVRCTVCNSKFNIAEYWTKDNETIVLRFFAVGSESAHKTSTAIKVKRNEKLLCAFPIICQKMILEGLDPYDFQEYNTGKVLDVDKTPRALDLKDGSTIQLVYKTFATTATDMALHGHQFDKKQCLKPQTCGCCNRRVWCASRTCLVCMKCRLLVHEGCLKDVTTFCHNTSLLESIASSSSPEDFASLGEESSPTIPANSSPQQQLRNRETVSASGRLVLEP